MPAYCVKATWCLLFSALFAASSFADSTSGDFSYCSNGKCSTIGADFFYRHRGMPLDLTFACKDDKAYALTFDDGPSGHVPQLLGILEEAGIKATFFVVGRNLASPEARSWLQMAHQAGHFIANHSYTHADLTKLTDEAILNEAEATRQVILDTLGHSPALEISTRVLRPPYGNIDERVAEVLRNAGYKSVRWNADRYDWQHGVAQMIVERVHQQLDYIATKKHQGQIFNHSILDLNHDWQAATLEAMPKVIPLIKSRGYEFVTLGKCLGSSGEEF